MSETPNYYAILTANVRYSKLINANEKLLFAEITALSNSTGICWASNNYFANLFDMTPQAISKWIRNLEKNHFIKCNYVYKKGSKEIEKREIVCINHSLEGINNSFKGINHSLEGYQHTIKDNNTSINNKTNNKIEIQSHLVKIDTHLLNMEALKEWLEFKKYKYQKTGVSKLANMLSKFSHDIQQEIVDKSIMNNYQGLFEPKQQQIKSQQVQQKSKQQQNNDFIDEYFFNMNKKDDDIIEVENE